LLVIRSQNITKTKWLVGYIIWITVDHTHLFNLEYLVFCIFEKAPLKLGCI